MRNRDSESSEGPRISRRNAIRIGLYTAAAAATAWQVRNNGFNLFQPSEKRRVQPLQEAYDQDLITQVDVVKKVSGEDVRGCILANSDDRAHVLQLRNFDFLHELKMEQDIIVGDHDPEEEPSKIGTILIPKRRGSCAVLEDEHGRKQVCTNMHVAENMPDLEVWKMDKETDLAVTDLENMNHIIPHEGSNTVPYTLDEFPDDEEAAGLSCEVEAYATNALLTVRGVLIDIRNSVVQGDFGLLVPNSPISASMYGGMSGSVLRHGGTPVASIHAGAGVLQKGNELQEIIHDRKDPRFDECSTVLLSLSGPQRMKKILS